MKIGILFPLSGKHPGIGPDFMDGLNAFLKYKQHTGTVIFLKESVGFGATEKEVCMKAEKLLIADDVDLLIAYIDEKVVHILYPLVQATGKLMLLVNPGANYPVNWISQPNVIRLNLQHAFLCWLTGVLAARSGTANAALATTFYDCGYLHSAVMVKNFIDSGGEIRFNYINNQAYDDSFEISRLTNFLADNPDCENLLCIFDELPASLFYKQLDKYKSADPLHLFVSPMMLPKKGMENAGTGFTFSIEGYLPWMPELENEDNLLFIKSCTRPSTIFSLLGWETAMVLDEILQQHFEDHGNAEQIVSHLKIKTLNGPRGGLKLDPETQFYIAPVIKYTLKAGSVIPEIACVSNIETEWRSFTSEPTEGAVTGWLNTYLCY